MENDLERDFFMTPEEAVKYGLIDSVIEGARAAEEIAAKAAKNGHTTESKK